MPFCDCRQGKIVTTSPVKLGLRHFEAREYLPSLPCLTLLGFKGSLDLQLPNLARQKHNNAPLIGYKFRWTVPTAHISSMNIDDILAGTDSYAIPRETLDLQELTRVWVTERSAPEILPWPDTLMERVLDRVRKQVSMHLLLATWK